MANERIPEDPYRPTFAGDDELRRPALLDDELQPDPELAEGPASSGRIAIFAVGIAIVLGAVFYGLNNSSINQAGTSSTAQNAPAPNPAPPQNTAQTSPPAAPPGMRDVTPHANTSPDNTSPGVTTGAAPARPQGAPAPAPTGQSANRPGDPATANPPSNNNN